ncbi:MAG: 5'/3'-nucleotidase SurE [Nannocystaceae bacterium]
MSRPLILVSNDDGVRAPGLAALAGCVARYGDVIVCAPEREQSGSSHAITLHSHLRVDQIRPDFYSVSGTPVDSVYVGALHVCPRPPDLVVAGINNGFNLGSDVIYSGTVGAAREGRLRGASALAVSVEHDCPPEIALAAVDAILPQLWRLHEAGERHLLNVNVPAQQGHTVQPLQVTTLGDRRYLDQVEERHDLAGRPYYWIGGPPALADDRAGEDTHAVAHGVISLTPISCAPITPHLDTWRTLFSS